MDAWGTSERPFLFIISPQVDGNIRGDVDAKVTILAPKFEESRAKLLSIPAERGLSFAVWPEDANPYDTAIDALGLNSESLIYVDEATRYFIVQGLLQSATKSSSKVEIAHPGVRALRQRKSTAEVALLTCVNEVRASQKVFCDPMSWYIQVTLLAIRETRDRMFIGISQSETQQLLHEALSAAGLKAGWGAVLFGEDAARPHGGGPDRKLGPNDLALIDIGASLHGYRSDLTRVCPLSSLKHGYRNPRTDICAW